MDMRQQLNFLEPMELQLVKDIGNKQLIEYGIQTENSNYRAHVGYKTQHIFVFPTQNGQKEVAKYSNQSKRTVSIDGKIITAKGYPIPINSIDSMQSIFIPHDVYQKYAIYPDMSTTTKGQLAVQIIFEMLNRMLIPLPVNINIKNKKAIQIKGTDIIISSKLRIQVKCDFNAGDKKFGGTGNVFLQTDECNPYKLY